jgi:hypothetical protein
MVEACDAVMVTTFLGRSRAARVGSGTSVPPAPPSTLGPFLRVAGSAAAASVANPGEEAA